VYFHCARIGDNLQKIAGSDRVTGGRYMGDAEARIGISRNEFPNAKREGEGEREREREREREGGKSIIRK